MATYNNEEGVWRTIGGRRVFIRTGQSLSDAMKESGKFKKKDNPYARNNEGGSDDNTSAFAQEAIDHWNKKNEEYKAQYGKDDEMAKSFAERWEKEKASRLKGEKYEQAVKDWENGKITDDEMYEIFDGNETKIKYNFERMGYKAPTKENIDKTNAEKLTAFGEKKEFTREELKARYGTDNVDLINAGREKENRVSLKEETIEESMQKVAKQYEQDKKEGKVAERLKQIEDEERQRRLEDRKEETKSINDTIREKASKKSTFKDDLPKHTEIKTQGTSNRKEVSENIQAHILDYYDSPEDFIEQMDAMSYLPTKWKAGEELAKGGSYLIYNGDMSDFLNELKINPKGKTFSEDKAFDMYTSLVGRESAKLYDRLQKNAYNKYKQSHPLTKMTLQEFIESRKK